MSDVTTNHSIPFLEGTDAAADIDTGLQDLAEHLDGIITVHDSGTLASRPVSTVESPGIQGRFYRVTAGADAGVVYFDTGTSWVPFNGSMQDTLASRPAANAVPQGTDYFATDTAVLYRSDGSSWHEVGFTADRVRVKRAADQAIAPGSFYALEFDTQEVDTNTMWTGGGTASRLTAQRGGIYHLTAKVNFDVGSSFAADYLAVMAAHYNSAAALQSVVADELFDFTSGFPNMARYVSWMFDMDAGDFVTVSGKTIGTGAVDLTGIATMVRVSPPN